MKQIIAVILASILFAWPLYGQPTPVTVQAATQAEVDAGTVANKYVSPLTLNNWSGGGGGANAVTAAAAAGSAGLFWLSNGADRTAVATDTVVTANLTTANVTNFIYGGVTFTGVTGTGNVVGSISPSFTTSINIPNGASPTTDAFGEIAGDNNAWAASRGALQIFDGTANTYAVATLASDTPSNGQVPTFNTGGTVTWETPAGGAALTATYVGYGDGSNLLTGEAAFNYTAASDLLAVGNIGLTTALSIGTDPADAGVIRLENAAVIGWEASPAGTDVTLTVNSSEAFVMSSTLNVTGNIVSSFAVTAAASNQFNWTGRSSITSPSNGVISFGNSGPSTNAGIYASYVVAPKTQAVSPYSTTITENRTVFTNEGATGAVTFSLPTAVAGYSYTFYVQDADGIIIDSASGDTIRIAADVTAADGSITSSTIGNSVTLVAINATEWVGIASIGTWTF